MPVNALPTNRGITSSRQDHANDHNELHRVHNDAVTLSDVQDISADKKFTGLVKLAGRSSPPTGFVSSELTPWFDHSAGASRFRLTGKDANGSAVDLSFVMGVDYTPLVIQANGVTQAQQPILNIIGGTVAEDWENNRINVTITSTGGADVYLANNQTFTGFNIFSRSSQASGEAVLVVKTAAGADYARPALRVMKDTVKTLELLPDGGLLTYGDSGGGLMQLAKDTSFSKQFAFGMRVPGGAITDDGVFSVNAGSTWGEVFRVLSTGGSIFKFNLVVDDNVKGIVLKDNAATPHYWRVAVSSAGALSTVDLGTTRPTT